MSLLAPILVSGPDARTFLQGQLTCDVDKLTPRNALLAACNSPQGRVQAVLTLIERPEGIVLLTTSELAEKTIPRLRKYVLRAKVKIENATRLWQVGALLPSDLARLNFAVLPANDTHRSDSYRSLIRWHDRQTERYLLLAADANSLSPNEFLLADIRAGLPHVCSQTHEAFVAQMLNLDLLDGISFEKGCYTGQEIVARAHFRGTVKRRMFRFAAACAPPLPGTRLLTNNEHAGDVVIAAATDAGCELLAVINVAQANSVIQLEDPLLAPMQRLPLPYSI